MITPKVNCYNGLWPVSVLLSGVYTPKFQCPKISPKGEHRREWKKCLQYNPCQQDWKGSVSGVDPWSESSFLRLPSFPLILIFLSTPSSLLSPLLHTSDSPLLVYNPFFSSYWPTALCFHKSCFKCLISKTSTPPLPIALSLLSNSVSLQVL